MARDPRIVQKLTRAIQQELGPNAKVYFADGLHDYIYMLVVDRSLHD
ncbi:MAG: hypothetical protein RIT28_5110, partial [Pseudomonadota bacterium]